jgi:hypothetical protein
MPDTSSQSEPIEIPPLTGIFVEPFSVGKLLRMMKFFGPAAVVASLSLGVGETIMVTGLGAWSEYGLFWLLILSVVVKGIFVTYLIGRYTAVTGQRIGHRLVMLPGPRGWLLLAVIVAELGLIGMGLTAVAKPCGNLITFLFFDTLPGDLSFNTWVNLWTNVIFAAAMAVSLLSSFQMLERQQIVICGVLVLGTIAATLLVQPDVGSMFVGAIRFGHLPAAPQWGPSAVRADYSLNMVVIFGYIGGSLSGHLAYSSWVGMSGWGINSHPRIDDIRQRAGEGPRVNYLPDDPDQARRLRKLLLPLKWDVGMGALVLLIVSTAFLAAGATILFPQQVTLSGNSWELLTKQASIWREIHEWMVPVYYVMIVAALWGTLASVPEAITRVTYDFLGAIWPRFEQFPIRRLKGIIVSGCFAFSIVWTWSGITFDLMTQIAAFLTVSLGLFVVFSCVLYFNMTLPRAYRPSWWVAASGIVSAVTLLLCAIGGGVGLARKVFAEF